MTDLNSVESRRARVSKQGTRGERIDEGKEMDAIRNSIPIFRKAREEKDENAARLREAAAKYGISAESSGVDQDDERHVVERQILREILGYDPTPKPKAFRAGKGVSNGGSSDGRRRVKPPKLSNPFRSKVGKPPSSRKQSTSPRVTGPLQAQSSSIPSSMVQYKAQQNDLITSMAGRLTRMEMSVKQMRANLVCREKEVLKLKRENLALQEASGGAQKAAEAIKATREENRVLKRQIHEMESFLADYGLIWVGDSEESRNSTSDINDTSDRKRRLHTGIHVPFSCLMQYFSYLDTAVCLFQAKIPHEISRAILIPPLGSTFRFSSPVSVGSTPLQQSKSRRLSKMS